MGRRAGLVGTLAAAGAVSVGVLASYSPWAVAAGVVSLGLVLIAFASQKVGRAAGVAALAGNLLLVYGFANVGLPMFGARVPLTDILLVLALPWALRGSWGPSGRRAVLWLAPLMGFGLLHLAFGLGRYGLLAVRDFLLLFEASFLLVGYHLGQLEGDRTVRWLRWVFLASAVYYATHPIRDRLAAVSPVVGIQREVPLLGSLSGAGPAAVAGFFFMALLRPFGRWSYLVAAVFAGDLLLFQGRGDYLAFLIATGTLVVAAGRGGRLARVRRALVVATVVASLVAVIILSLAPGGRLGPATPSFYIQQLGTLVGREGPGAGSLLSRLEWIPLALQEVREVPYGWALGVGFGPDLIGGFSVAPGVLVRKPHNDYLEVFARLGLVGFGMFLGLLAAIVLPVLRAARRGATAPGFLWWVLMAAVPYLVIAATQPLLSFPYGTVPFFTIAGLGLAAVDRAKPIDMVAGSG